VEVEEFGGRGEEEEGCEGVEVVEVEVEVEVVEVEVEVEVVVEKTVEGGTSSVG
jgi:hypothetical protein